MNPMASHAYQPGRAPYGPPPTGPPPAMKATPPPTGPPISSTTPLPPRAEGEYLHYKAGTYSPKSQHLGTFLLQI